MQFSAAVNDLPLAAPVTIGSDWSFTPLDPNNSGLWPDGLNTMAIRCIAIADANPVAEAGGSLGDTITQTAASASQAALTAAQSVASSAGDALLSGLKTLAPWLVVAGVLYLLAARGLSRLEGR